MKKRRKENNILHIVVLMTVIFFLTVFCLSCGKKADPRCPHISCSAAISDLSASPDDHGVRLTWSLPGKDIDIDHISIFRSELDIDGGGCPGCPRKYSLIAKLSPGDPKLMREGEKRIMYHDTDVKRGNLYSYKVSICILSGVCSAESNVAEIKVP